MMIICLKNIMLRLNTIEKLAILFLTAVLVSHCDTKDYTPVYLPKPRNTEDSVTITLSLATKDMVKGSLISDEISDASLIVFDADSSFITFLKLSNTHNKLRLSPGKKIFVALANYGEDSVDNYKNLTLLLQKREERPATQLKKSIFSAICVRDVNADDSLVIINMRRLLSKITFVFDRVNLNPQVEISILAIQLCNVPKYTNIFSPNSPSLKSEIEHSGDFINTNPEPSSHSTATPLYLYENRQGTLGINDNPLLKNPGALSELCTYIEIYAQYSSPERSGRVIYRYYPGNNNFNNFDIDRDTHYKENISFKGDALNGTLWRVDKSQLKETEYQVTVSPEPICAGIVSGGGYYKYNELPQLSATPNSGYKFDKWEPPVTPVASNIHYRAMFLDESPPVYISSINVQLNKSTIYEGESTFLSYLIYPEEATDKRVVWSSSDISIATVNEAGVITGSKEGECVIIGSSLDGSGVKGFAQISVLKRESNVLIESISLNSIKETLIPGEQIRVMAEIKPYNASNKQLFWSSYNSSIATVDGLGNVTAHSVGNTKIKASSTDGSYTYGLFDIQVIEGLSPVTGVDIEMSSAELIRGEKLTIGAVVHPQNARNKIIEWYSSNNLIASVSPSGEVSANSNGVCTITAITQEGGYSASCNITVYDTLSISVSTIEIQHHNQTTNEVEYYTLVIYARLNLPSPSNMTLVNNLYNHIYIEVEYSYRDNGVEVFGVSTVRLNRVNNNDTPWIFTDGGSHIILFCNPLDSQALQESLESFTFKPKSSSVYLFGYKINW